MEGGPLGVFRPSSKKGLALDRLLRPKLMNKKMLNDGGMPKRTLQFLSLLAIKSKHPWFDTYCALENKWPDVNFHKETRISISYR